MNAICKYSSDTGKNELGTWKGIQKIYLERATNTACGQMFFDDLLDERYADLQWQILKATNTCNIFEHRVVIVNL